MPTNMARQNSARVRLPDLPTARAQQLMLVEMWVGRIEKAPSQGLFSIFGGERGIVGLKPHFPYEALGCWFSVG